jgi:hypothetical protein
MNAAEALAVRRTADGDASWFQKHPDRSYRVRLASPAEITLKRQAMDMKPVPKGCRVFACIWRYDVHSRCTALVLSEVGNDADGASEEKAKALFLLAVSSAPKTRH